MEKAIRHEGVIEQLQGSHVVVRILQASACASCKVASRCATSDSRAKLVDVFAADPSHWHVGQQVVVSTQSSMAGRVLFLGFGLPLLLMLAVLAVALAAGCDEGLMALLMLGSLIPYYAVLWLYRDSIAHRISFRIEEGVETTNKTN